MCAPAATLLGCTTQARVSAAAGVTVTLACWAIATVPTVADTVLVCATVELSVPVASPFVAFVLVGWVSVLPLSVDASVTGVTLHTCPYVFRAATVIVLAHVSVVSA